MRILEGMRRLSGLGLGFGRKTSEADSIQSTPQKAISDAEGSDAGFASTSCGDLKTAGWSEESTCHVCSAVLSKRRLNPKHHCRVCNKTVCGACSPSSVWLESENGLQRVCNPCVRNAERGPTLLHGLVLLEEELRELGAEGPKTTLGEFLGEGDAAAEGHPPEATNGQPATLNLESIDDAISACRIAASRATALRSQEREELRQLEERNRTLQAQLDEERKQRKSWTWRGSHEGMASDLSCSTHVDPEASDSYTTPSLEPQPRQTCVNRGCVIA